MHCLGAPCPLHPLQSQSTRFRRNCKIIVPDPLYLSLWYPTFSGPDAAARLLAVLHEIPFSAQLPGVTYTAVHPVSWSEATVLERRHRPGVAPEEAVDVVADLFHDDYAYVFEAAWDLWVLQPDGQWALAPLPLRIVAHGETFEDGVYKEAGHIEIELGLDAPFLPGEDGVSAEAQEHVRENIARLIDFTNRAERGSRASARLLWSESDENLAQKLVASLQRLQ